MNASQVPERDGGPVADSGSTGDPEQSAYVTGEPALWGEALPWAERVGVHDLSDDGRTGLAGDSEYQTGSPDHGEVPSGFSGRPDSAGYPRLMSTSRARPRPWGRSPSYQLPRPLCWHMASSLRLFSFPPPRSLRPTRTTSGPTGSSASVGATGGWLSQPPSRAQAWSRCPSEWLPSTRAAAGNPLRPRQSTRPARVR